MATVTMLGSSAPADAASGHAQDHGDGGGVTTAAKRQGGDSANRNARAANGTVESAVGSQEGADSSGPGGKQMIGKAQNRAGPQTSVTNNADTSASAVDNSTNNIQANGEGPARPFRTQYAVVLVLSPLNGSFERKSLIVPFAPDVLKLGRQTNSRTVPAPNNGYFDSRVLSRQHAEVWADRQTGRVWIKDSQSSNGTYINDKRLSSDNAESEPHELRKNDVLELGIDITTEDGVALLHRKISAKVERISIMSLSSGPQHLSVVAPSIEGSSSALNNGINGPNGDAGRIAKKTVAGRAPGTVTQGTGTGAAGAAGTGAGPGTGPAGTTKMRRLCIPSGATAPMGLAGPKAGMERLDFALFGDVDTTLEDLILSYSNNAPGTGPLAGSNINTTLAFEHAIKRLVAQIHAVRVDAAKIQSVQSLLQEIRRNQKKSSVLSSLSNQLAVKDAYIAELEGKVASRDAVEAELKRERARADTLEKENKRLRAEAASNASSSVLATALAGARADAEAHAEKARAAEERLQQSAETIDDLLRTIDMLKENPPPPSTTDPSSSFDESHHHQHQHQVRQHNEVPSRPRSRTLSGHAGPHHHPQQPSRIAAAAATMRPHTEKGQSPLTAAVVPMTTAVGVVVIGISVMSLLNCLSRSAR